MHPEGVLLFLHVQPGAKRSAWAGRHGDALKVRIAAPPVEGKANAALSAFLAETFALRPSAVTLVGGDTSRTKRVLLRCDANERAAILTRLGELFPH
ncbi:DUF167 domain-containing protein [Hydrogenophilus thiooxidans]|uniref:DUF167 domain-containing protein n=1 Tax=Hydrogenophilus thiooxidans TaxID=2820326 RepID=UPI0020182780|nr:DUF167 domain-containing protein [Hydrogenophilus thiooxidans]